MWHEILVALCLVMVIEGIMPFLAPQLWRRGILDIARMPPRNIRIMGLVSMLIGTGLLYLVNS